MNVEMSILRATDFGLNIGAMDKQAFAEMIRAARDAKNLRSIDLGVRLGRDGSFVSRLENGSFKETPPPDVLAALHDVLGIDEIKMLRALGYLRTDEAEKATVDPTATRLCAAVESVDWREEAHLAGTLIEILRGIAYRQEHGSQTTKRRSPQGSGLGN